MSARLTEKKLEDYRFRKTEEAIFKAFFVEGVDKNFGVGEMARMIGISRATFYRHHRALHQIAEDYERYILDKYFRLMEELRKKDDLGLRQKYYRMLVFILQNRGVFRMVIERKDLRVLEKMVYELKLEVEVATRLSYGSERIFRVYMGEILGLINDWGSGGFKEIEMVKLLNNIMYLTETVRKRLLPLMD